jgi:hypothetical protein
VLVCASLGFGALIAQPALAQDVAAAEALFRAGRSLMEQGKYAEACDKLAESQRLDPSSGTLLNLATCHEKQGKTATAWAEYLAAARLSRTQQKMDRAETAEKRAAALEPTLSYLTLESKAPLPGLEVRRNGVRLEAAVLGTRLPVDPGDHVIEVTAPGHRMARLTVAVGAQRDSKVVVLPELEPVSQSAPAAVAPAQQPAKAAPVLRPAPGSAPPPPTEAPGEPEGKSPAPSDATASASASPEDSGSALRTVGWVGVAAGAAGLAFGGVTGAMALATQKALDDGGCEQGACYLDQWSDVNRLNDLRTMSSIGFIAGGVLAAGGVALLIAAPSQESSPASAAVGLYLGLARAGVAGRF